MGYQLWVMGYAQGSRLAGLDRIWGEEVGRVI